MGGGVAGVGVGPTMYTPCYRPQSGPLRFFLHLPPSAGPPPLEPRLLPPLACFPHLYPKPTLNPQYSWESLPLHSNLVCPAPTSPCLPTTQPFPAPAPSIRAPDSLFGSVYPFMGLCPPPKAPFPCPLPQSCSTLLWSQLTWPHPAYRTLAPTSSWLALEREEGGGVGPVETKCYAGWQVVGGRGGVLQEPRD